MNKELIERLRGVWADNGAGYNTEFSVDMHEAADALEKADARILELEERFTETLRRLGAETPFDAEMNFAALAAIVKQQKDALQHVYRMMTDGSEFYADLPEEISWASAKELKEFYILYEQALALDTTTADVVLAEYRAQGDTKEVN